MVKQPGKIANKIKRKEVYAKVDFTSLHFTSPRALLDGSNLPLPPISSMLIISFHITSLTSSSSSSSSSSFSLISQFKAQKKVAKKKAKSDKIKEIEELGEAAPPKQIPRTIENTRVADETSVLPNDVEILGDEADDEFADYYKNIKKPKIMLTTRPKCSKKLYDFIGI